VSPKRPRQSGARHSRPRLGEPTKNDPLEATEPGRRSPTPRLAGLLAVILAVAGLIVWRWLPSGLEGNGPGFNVLLITLDTTRADHLGCYGYPGDITPNIDRLAAGGTRFAQCTSAAPSTLPSHATIMTGVYPYVHGARHNVGYRVCQANDMLAEALARAGYRTGAFAAAMVVKRGTGLDQGFETYDDAGNRHERRADEVCDRALTWLRGHAADKWFAWVHFVDPHAPYDPPAMYGRLHSEPYAAEIAFADAQVGRLLDELTSLGLRKRTLVVVTADHGEGLGQHSEPTHLTFVYDTTMSVPLIFNCPGQIPAGTTIQSQTRTIDIAPTVLAFLGVDVLSNLPRAQGTDLTAFMLEPDDATDLPAYGESLSGKIVLGTSPLRCLRADGWKYIHAPRPELYNVQQDPAELYNLAADDLERVDVMCEQIRDIVADSPEPASGQDAAARLDSATLAGLAALGYVGGSSTTALPEGDELSYFEPVGADPKDHAADFALLGQATARLQAGEPAQAEVAYRKLVRKFPSEVPLRLQLARALFLQGKFDDAIGVHKRLAAAHPDNAEVEYGLGKLLTRTGKGKEAIEHFLSAVQIDPQYPEAHYDLGVALLKAGRTNEGAECFRRALAVRPTYVDAMVNLGAVLTAQGQLAEAIAQYRRAIDIAPEDAGIYYNLGNALLRTGDTAGAVQAYQQAIRLKPDFMPARRALEQARSRS